jgi:hypothetical protein
LHEIGFGGELREISFGGQTGGRSCDRNFEIGLGGEPGQSRLDPGEALLAHGAPMHWA